MRFAIFDQMEAQPAALAEVYAQRLALLEAADQAGFWCYFKSEHHFTPLDTAPSVSTWLASVAARTSNLRIGSLVYLLPFYHPIRLLEEIATLDHLSGGRLEIGVGRGISPPEHTLWGMDPELARARSEEALEILLTGMQVDSLSFEGEFWQFSDAPITVRPLQKPHPPLWYPGNVEVAGARGFNTVVGGPPEVIAQARTRLAALHEQSRLSTSAAPLMGAALRVYLANDEDAAQARARQAWRSLDDNLSTLWRRFEIDDIPNSPTANGDFDLAQKIGLVLAGTPEMLIQRIGEVAGVGVDPILLGFDWGDLSAAEVRRSFDLVAERVMPVFA